MFRQKLAESTGIDVKSLPSSYQIIGDILLLKLPEIRSMPRKKRIALAAANLLPYIKTVCEIRGINGEFRKPLVIRLAGNGLETVHKEQRNPVQA